MLVSWAVPKGPSLDPARKSLAVKVEDHPYAYGWFEGVIPSGYGKGDVICGTTAGGSPTPSTPTRPTPATAIEQGEFKFVLIGRKLRGPLRDHQDERTQRQAAGSDEDVAADPQGATTTPSPAGTPRTTRCRCSAAAPTTTSPAGRPGRWPAATADELAAARRAPRQGRHWTVAGVTSPITTSTR